MSLPTQRVYCLVSNVVIYSDLACSTQRGFGEMRRCGVRLQQLSDRCCCTPHALQGIQYVCYEVYVPHQVQQR